MVILEREFISKWPDHGERVHRFIGFRWGVCIGDWSRSPLSSCTFGRDFETHADLGCIFFQNDNSDSSVSVLSLPTVLGAVCFSQASSSRSLHPLPAIPSSSLNPNGVHWLNGLKILPHQTSTIPHSGRVQVEVGGDWGGASVWIDWSGTGEEWV